MAKLIKGTLSIEAVCIGCNGAKSSFVINGEHKNGLKKTKDDNWWVFYYLYRCTSCYSGALGILESPYKILAPGDTNLINFWPDPARHLEIPNDVPEGIVKEFREAEECLGYNCNRAAGALVRSVVDKVLRDNGYKTSNSNLKKQIDEAYKDNIITKARMLRAQDIRLFGNDILHEEWKRIEKSEVETAIHYCQRLLEDFYDDRETVIKGLVEADRINTNK